MKRDLCLSFTILFIYYMCDINIFLKMFIQSPLFSAKTVITLVRTLENRAPLNSKYKKKFNIFSK